MGFAGEGCERGGDFGEVGADVGGDGAGVAAVGVSGVGACDGVAKIAFYPCERGVPEPVGTYSMSKSGGTVWLQIAGPGNIDLLV